MTSTQEKYAEKIAKLLAKAESTSPEEAETLIAKAQELMAQYAIEQAMIDQARGVERDEIEQRTVTFTGNWREELADLCWRICQVNDCKVAQYRTTITDTEGRKAVRVYRGGWNAAKGDYDYFSKVSSRKKAVKYEITGFCSDLERVLLLESSLRLQAVSAVTTWWNTEGKARYDWESYAHKVRMRGEFLEEFTDAVHAKLTTAYRTGKSAAIKVEAERTGKSEAQTDESVALVLRSRKERVDEWYDKRYGKLRASRGGSRQYISAAAREAGYSAGRRADVGQSSMKARKGLTR